MEISCCLKHTVGDTHWGTSQATFAAWLGECLQGWNLNDMHAGANSVSAPTMSKWQQWWTCRVLGSLMQSCSLQKKVLQVFSARPGMKLSGKGTDALMGPVNGWWQEELQPDPSWASMSQVTWWTCWQGMKSGRRVITVPCVHP
jgi:hypothetical protein